MAGVSFPAFPKVDPLAAEDITDLGNVVLQGDIRSNQWDGGSDLSDGKDATATAGFFLDSSAGAIQVQNLFAEGGTFNNITILGSVITLNSGTSFPGSPSDGELFYRTDQNRVYRYDGAGAAWIELDYIPDSSRIASGAIATAAIANAAITTAKIDTAAVTNAKIGNAAVDTAQIASAAITDAKVNDLSADKLTAGTIDASVITVTNLNASNITTGTITARHYRTASSGTRLEINPGVSGETGHGIDLYVSGTKRGSVDADTIDTVVALSGANGWGAKVSSSGSEVEAEGNRAQMLGNSGSVSLTVDGSGVKAQTPSTLVAITAYRQGTTDADDIAHFRSNDDSTDKLQAMVKIDGDFLNKNNSYGGFSDKRLKKNIKTARSYLGDLRKVRITTHTLKANDKKLLGPIAQELQTIFPGLVREGLDGYLAVKHSVFVPMLITAVQELADRIEVLEKA